MAQCLRRKLEHFTRLSTADRAKIAELSQADVHAIRARYDIIREGERPNFVNLILEGWAVRHKTLEDGRRQIIAFLIPGDLCDLNVFYLKQMDHSIGALTPVKLARVPSEALQDIERNFPRLAQALMWDMLVQAAIQREWTVNLGQRSAIERISHLICELQIRLEMVGACEEGSCALPLTQVDLSEATGMTAVHVNRTIQELRARGLVEWNGRDVHVPDLEALKQIAMFDDNYLHRDRPGAHLDANE
ncbi:MAG TPA: Crp/Fnr family transcriptional regulator [Sphingomicrobium sp.]|nr:Crp/Fnr family transcriptional regulator [Sphingomicrobium sp.]